MTTTRFKERDRVTNQAKMNKKRMKMMRILIYGGMNVIETPPLHMNRILMESDMYPKFLVWKWEKI